MFSLPYFVVYILDGTVILLHRRTKHIIIIHRLTGMHEYVVSLITREQQYTQTYKKFSGAKRKALKKVV